MEFHKCRSISQRGSLSFSLLWLERFEPMQRMSAIFLSDPILERTSIIIVSTFSGLCEVTFPFNRLKILALSDYRIEPSGCAKQAGSGRIGKIFSNKFSVLLEKTEVSHTYLLYPLQWLFLLLPLIDFLEGKFPTLVLSTLSSHCLWSNKCLSYNCPCWR